MTQQRCGKFPWCGRRSSGETVRHARSAVCRRCKASSAPSTPCGTRSRSRSMSPGTPRGRRHPCFSSNFGFKAGNDKSRGNPAVNPRALPILLHPDHKPRKVQRVHACHSPRRGCHDHRCHKEKSWCTIS